MGDGRPAILRGRLQQRLPGVAPGIQVGGTEGGSRQRAGLQAGRLAQNDRFGRFPAVPGDGKGRQDIVVCQMGILTLKSPSLQQVFQPVTVCIRIGQAGERQRIIKDGEARIQVPDSRIPA